MKSLVRGSLFRIFDNGPDFMLYLIEVRPGDPPPLMNRYEVNRWLYDGGKCVDAPARPITAYLPETYTNGAEAFKVANALNDQHQADFDAFQKTKKEK